MLLGVQGQNEEAREDVAVMVGVLARFACFACKPPLTSLEVDSESD